MGVKVRRKKSKWCLVVDYRGRRLTRAISSDRKVADEVRRQVEARLALGDLSMFEKPTSETLTFEKYADRWLKDHASIECKPSTYRSYEQLLRIHIKPRFGTKKIVQISRESIKKFLAEMSQATRVVDTQTGETALKYSRNTLRQMVCALRSFLNAAVEDGIVQSNPDSRIGKFAKTERPAHKAQAMTRTEKEQFLDAINQVCEEWYPFFLTALRAGLRKGELIALKWGDIQFGASVDDPNRFILVQRNWAAGAFTTPKNGKSRRVDLSRGLREVLVGLRDKHLLEAFMAGKASIADDLVFSCSVWDENEKVWRHGRGSEPLKP